jgi:hypothetical protein
MEWRELPCMKFLVSTLSKLTSCPMDKPFPELPMVKTENTWLLAPKYSKCAAVGHVVDEYLAVAAVPVRLR